MELTKHKLTEKMHYEPYEHRPLRGLGHIVDGRLGYRDEQNLYFGKYKLPEKKFQEKLKYSQIHTKGRKYFLVQEMKMGIFFK